MFCSFFLKNDKKNKLNLNMWNFTFKKTETLAEKIERELEEKTNKRTIPDLSKSESANIAGNQEKMSTEVNDNKIFFGDWVDGNKVIERVPNLRKKFVPHVCDPRCMINTDTKDENIQKSKNPFLKPFKKGFGRSFLKCPNGTFGIVYFAPCGIILESFSKIKTYLEVTKVTDLSVSNFTMSINFKLSRLENKYNYFNEDICNGEERNSTNFLAPSEDCLKEYGPYLKYPFYETATFEDIKKYATKLKKCTTTDECFSECSCECVMKVSFNFDYNLQFKICFIFHLKSE